MRLGATTTITGSKTTLALELVPGGSVFSARFLGAGKSRMEGSLLVE